MSLIIKNGHVEVVKEELIEQYFFSKKKARREKSINQRFLFQEKIKKWDYSVIRVPFSASLAKSVFTISFRFHKMDYVRTVYFDTCKNQNIKTHKPLFQK